MNKTNKKLIGGLGMVALTFTLSFQVALAGEINPENILKLVNESREKEGESDLVFNDKLMSVAKDKLNDMIANHYFAHTSPSGVTPWHWFEKNDYDYQYAGENLAINFTSAEGEHEAWMNSPTHRKNIMNPKYQEIGVAVGAGEVNGQTSLIAVQEFGALPGAEASIANRNFSGQSGKNLIQKDNKIVPQVLSVKNENIPVNSGSEQSAWGSFSDFIFSRGGMLYAWLWGMAIVLVSVSLTAVPLTFILVSVERIGRHFKKKEEDDNAHITFGI